MMLVKRNIRIIMTERSGEFLSVFFSGKQCFSMLKQDPSFENAMTSITLKVSL